MNQQKKSLKVPGIIFLFFLIGGLAYLPNVGSFGYFNDDWYLMFSANALGGEAFASIFQVDRPMRAYVMSTAYSLFGLNPLYYNISAIFFRILGGLTFYWSLHMIWPERKSSTLAMGLLFTIYPGFLAMPNAIDYQSQHISLFLALFSIALTVLAVQSGWKLISFTYMLIAALFGWFYLGLVEYFLGLEILRLGLLVILSYRKKAKNIWSRAFTILRYGLIPFTGPLLFLYWRLFLFSAERKATDVGAQLGALQDSPLPVLTNWVATLLRDSFESIFLAWGVPLASMWNLSFRVRETVAIGVLSVLILGYVFWVFKKVPDIRKDESSISYWPREASLLGLAVVFAGMIPVVLANRSADFHAFSRYMLASSPGAVVFLVAVLSNFGSRDVRAFTVAMLIFSGILTHFFNGEHAALVTEKTRNFWWQVYWRAPLFQPQTTLVANYSHASIEEDYFIWGPANLIYSPISLEPQRLRPALWSSVLTRDSLHSIQLGESPRYVDRRSIVTYEDYGTVIMLSQPTQFSCVQFIDGDSPVVSAFEQYDVMLASDSSNLDRIILSGVVPEPPSVIFGQEPVRDWCYFYEKASLALQQGNYDKVAALEKQAKKSGFSAADPVEWMPFLQAHVIRDDFEAVSALAPRIKKDPFLQTQACSVLSTLKETSVDMKNQIDSIFCVQ